MFIDLEKQMGKRIWLNPAKISMLAIRKDEKTNKIYADVIIDKDVVLSVKRDNEQEAKNFIDMFL